MKTFEELTRLVEATPPLTAPTPGASTPGYASALGSVGNLFSKAGSTLSKFTPGAIANKINTAYNKGVFAATADAIVGVGKSLTTRAKKQLDKFFLSVDLPTGWPKTGSAVQYVGIYAKDLRGVVGKTSTIGDTVTLNINFPRSASQPEDRNAVATHTLTERPFSSVTKWYMQIYKPTGWVNDSRETGHKPAFYWDIKNNIFVYSMDDRSKPRMVTVPLESVPAASRTAGSRVSNVIATDGKTYNGIVVDVITIDSLQYLRVNTADY